MRGAGGCRARDGGRREEGGKGGGGGVGGIMSERDGSRWRGVAGGGASRGWDRVG